MMCGKTSVGEAGTAPGPRFTFGRNWRSFLATVDSSCVAFAERSLRDMLEMDSLSGKSFLDVGCGSGLFSLAARRLGARVTSFDFDPESVACARLLRDRYFRGAPDWQILEGSVLDSGFVTTLGTYDVVYAWGVLHHTGRLWTALENSLSLVGRGGLLFVAIYNDAGWKSRFWLVIKRAYLSKSGRIAVLGLFVPYFFCRTVIASLTRFRNEFVVYRRTRGMSIFHDWIDWLGGYPYEFASAATVIEYCTSRGFGLRKQRLVRGIGNNQFVFERRDSTPNGAV